MARVGDAIRENGGLVLMVDEEDRKDGVFGNGRYGGKR